MSVVVGDVRIGRSDNQNSCQILCVTWLMIRYISVHDNDDDHNNDDDDHDEGEEKENDDNQEDNDDDQIRRAGTVASQRCN